MSQSTNKHSSASTPSASVNIFLSYVPTIVISYLRESNSAETKPSTSGEIINFLECSKVFLITFLILYISSKIML